MPAQKTPSPLRYTVDRTFGVVTLNPGPHAIVVDESDLTEMLGAVQQDADLSGLSEFQAH
jgi:hypothetical protein